jgi:hypothetical protein
VFISVHLWFRGCNPCLKKQSQFIRSEFYVLRSAERQFEKQSQLLIVRLESVIPSRRQEFVHLSVRVHVLAGKIPDNWLDYIKFGKKMLHISGSSDTIDLIKGFLYEGL